MAEIITAYKNLKEKFRLMEEELSAEKEHSQHLSDENHSLQGTINALQAENIQRNLKIDMLIDTNNYLVQQSKKTDGSHTISELTQKNSQMDHQINIFEHELADIKDQIKHFLRSVTPLIPDRVESTTEPVENPWELSIAKIIFCVLYEP
jgi:chromosome segregation ATPase